jgi:putative Mg2+ transporter-C (MgtC) family protein
MPWEVVASRLFLALLLGIIVGLERQLRQNTAGLRMNSLVAIGAASFVIFGNSFGTPDSLARISSQIITGIGFLGGGVIMREGASIKGIATAATLWCSAAIGMFAGAGFVQSAVVCTVFIVATNLLLRPLAWIIKKRIDLPYITSGTKHAHTYTLCVTCENNGQDHTRARLLQEIHSGELHLQKLESKKPDSANRVEITVTMTSPDSKDKMVERMVSHLSLQPGISAASWNMAEGA